MPYWPMYDRRVLAARANLATNKMPGRLVQASPQSNALGRAGTSNGMQDPLPGCRQTRSFP